MKKMQKCASRVVGTKASINRVTFEVTKGNPTGEVA